MPDLPTGTGTFQLNPPQVHLPLPARGQQWALAAAVIVLARWVAARRRVLPSTQRGVTYRVRVLSTWGAQHTSRWR